MAKTKLEKEALIKETTNNTAEQGEVTPSLSEEAVQASPVPIAAGVIEPGPKAYTTPSGPTYNELLTIVQQLAQEVQTLKNGQTQSVQNNNTDLVSVLTALTNRKSDREVSIVHNKELIGNLTTHIDLSNVTIDFSHLGETRLLSWQQFEEISSKYRSFFDQKIILVSGEYADIAEQYNLPCTQGEKHLLTQKDIARLPKLSVPELETFIESLNKEDKDTVFSFWLGKCYTREPGFYDRHKMDTLNRLSEGMFDTVLLVMNGDSRIIPTAKEK